MVRQRVCIRFRKEGDLRWIGHRDVARLLERLFRRAGIPLGRSEGFHPKPRMSFPSALALGLEGREEIVDVELSEPCTAEELLARLRGQALPGLSFASADVLPPGARKAQLRCAAYEVPIPAERRQQTVAEAERLLADSTRPVLRSRGRNPVDLRQSLEELDLRAGMLRMCLRADPRGSAGPRDVLAALGLADLEAAGACLVRTRVEVER